MPAGSYKIVVDQGSTWTTQVTVTNSNGTLMALGGYTARMQVRKAIDATTVDVELTTANGRITLNTTTSKLTLSLTAAETAALTRNGFYDLEIVSAGGQVTRLLEGTFVIKPNVTR